MNDMHAPDSRTADNYVEPASSITDDEFLKELITHAKHNAGKKGGDELEPDALTSEIHNDLALSPRGCSSNFVIILEIEGGMLQASYCSDPTLQLVVVDWDVEGRDLRDKDIVEINGGSCTYGSVIEYSTCPIADLHETDVEKALAAAGIAYPRQP